MLVTINKPGDGKISKHVRTGTELQQLFDQFGRDNVELVDESDFIDDRSPEQVLTQQTADAEEEAKNEVPEGGGVE